MKEFLTKKTEYVQILEHILDYEEKRKNIPEVINQARHFDHEDPNADSLWEWTDVGVTVAALNQLIARGAVRLAWHSNKTRYYRLIDRATLRSVVDELSNGEAVVMSTKAAKDEEKYIQEMEHQFDDYLTRLLSDGDRLTRALNFGGNFDVLALKRWIISMFGEKLYDDITLALIHQFALANPIIRNCSDTNVGRAGFNLALFGSPGSGKTFAIDKIIRGSSDMGVPCFGLPGRNRYCGGMSAAKFIRLGEAYQGMVYNFVVTEFNAWFKYDGMVEPLKLAMEQDQVSLELKNETIGPYKFSSFFAVNYNTKVDEIGYKVTVGDPNFNAIEDRTLCRLHRPTKDRYFAVRESQRKLRQGKIDFSTVQTFRDLLVLVYAIESHHQKVHGIWPTKPIKLGDEIEDALDKADREALDKYDGNALVQFSTRLADRAVKVASAAAVMSYFKSKEPCITVGPAEIEYAVQSYRDEIRVRMGEEGG